MSEHKPVTRCVCREVTFAELKQAGVASMREIAERFGCGTACGHCKPYLARLLATGETEFEVFDSHSS